MKRYMFVFLWVFLGTNCAIDQSLASLDVAMDHLARAVSSVFSQKTVFQEELDKYLQEFIETAAWGSYKKMAGLIQQALYEALQGNFVIPVVRAAKITEDQITKITGIGDNVSNIKKYLKSKKRLEEVKTKQEQAEKKRLEQEKAKKEKEEKKRLEKEKAQKEKEKERLEKEKKKKQKEPEKKEQEKKKELKDIFSEEDLKKYVKENIFNEGKIGAKLSPVVRSLFALSWLSNDKKVIKDNKAAAKAVFANVKKSKNKDESLLYALESILVIDPLLIDDVVAYVRGREGLKFDAYTMVLDIYDIVNRRVAVSIGEIDKAGKEGGPCKDLRIALQYPVTLASFKNDVMAKVDLYKDKDGKAFLKEFAKKQNVLLQLLKKYKDSLKNSCKIAVEGVEDILTLNDGRVWCRSEFPGNLKPDDQGILKNPKGGKSVYYQTFDKELKRAANAIKDYEKLYVLHREVAKQKILNALNAFGTYVKADKVCTMCLSGDITNSDVTDLTAIEDFLNKLQHKTSYAKDALKNVRLIRFVRDINDDLSKEGLAGALDGVAIVRYFLDKDFEKRKDDPCSEKERKTIIEDIGKLLNGEDKKEIVLKRIMPLMGDDRWRDIIGDYQVGK